ncbi:MAG: pyrroline-5-carboxylate reductase [Tepidisphaeraceae bacterium]|jgi:pyrroline-5-carboxylate reductase
MKYDLAIIGAGVMAEAIARGVLAGKQFAAGRMIAADVSADRRKLFESLGIKTTESAAEAAQDAQSMLLSVKPYQMEQVLAGLNGHLGEETLIISIAAGIGSGFIARHLGEGKNWRIVRAMPNTPMLVGEGMVAIAPGGAAGAADLAEARKIFESAAQVIEVDESKMDAVTALSGSGPAYFFFLVEQMFRAGEEMGLTPEESRTLAIQTAVGAAKMMSRSPDSPSEHRRRVTTPNGTTHAAISHMESKNWPEITVEALKAAKKRSTELGK